LFTDGRVVVVVVVVTPIGKVTGGSTVADEQSG
jgi:hypothetical protein